MNTKQNMIIDNQLNKIITPDVAMCAYNSEEHRYDIKFKTGKSYPYGYNRISWLKNPKVLDPTFYHITHWKESFLTYQLFMYLLTIIRNLND